MHRGLKLVSYALPLFSLALIAGCASVSLEESWKSPDYKGTGFKKVMVLGMARRPEVRKMFEDDLVKQLKDCGIEAVPSYVNLKEAWPMDRAAVSKAVKECGADSVLVTGLLRHDGLTQPAVRQGDVAEHVTQSAGRIEDPAPAYKYSMVELESHLFDVANKRVVWAARTKNTAPRDLNTDVQDFARIIAKDLKDKGLI
jgi:hypothetical protein